MDDDVLLREGGEDGLDLHGQPGLPPQVSQLTHYTGLLKMNTRILVTAL